MTFLQKPQDPRITFGIMSVSHVQFRRQARTYFTCWNDDIKVMALWKAIVKRMADGNKQASKLTAKQTSSSLSESQGPRLATPTTRAISFWKGDHEFLEYLRKGFLEEHGVRRQTVRELKKDNIFSLLYPNEKMFDLFRSHLHIQLLHDCKEIFSLPYPHVPQIRVIQPAKSVFLLLSNLHRRRNICQFLQKALF